MVTCSLCAAENAEGDKFCRACGQPLDPALLLPLRGPVAHGDATLLLTRSPSRAAPAPLRSAPLAKLFENRDKLVLGRAPDCDVCLQHPSVSRYHALLERLPQGLQLSDLRSVNGVFLDGQRLTAPVFVRERQRVGIGPYLFTLVGDSITSLDNSRSLRLEARGLEKQVTLATGQTRKLLENINLVVNPGEFVSLLGPSGSGKSTLMDCLNGRRRATGGQVLANGEDFYQHFDNFRQSLGYVPQRDIVHTQLTVARALYYTARLRLPVDTDRAELAARVEEVLEEMELAAHRNTLVANLSGGQVKRVSLGAELLGRPCLLYIDEATSGLDAGTEARMMRLFRQLSGEGRSVVCITHNVDNVDQCHLVLVLGRGRLLYCGPPAELPPYFGVRRVSDVYDRLHEKEPEAWEGAFRESSLYAEFVARRLETQTLQQPEPARPAADREDNTLVAASAAPPPPSRKPLLAQRFHDLTTAAGRAMELIKPVSEGWHQFKVLTRRYAELVWADPRSLRLMFLQAPIVALFLLVGFVHKPFQQEMPSTRKLTDKEREYVQKAREGLDAVRQGKVVTHEQQEALRTLGLLRAGGTLDEWVTGKGNADQERLLDYLLTSSDPVIPDRLIVNPGYTYLMLIVVALVALWFGCNNAAKEIVKEEAVYGRERAVNLRIVPYLGSKFVVLSAVAAVQTLLLMLFLFGILEGLYRFAGHDAPPLQYQLDYASMYGVLLLLAMTGIALGLLLSACVSSPDRASTLLPYVLIPQMILGGGLIVVRHGLIYGLAVTLSPVYWAYRAIRRGATALPEGNYYRMSYDDSVWICCAALVVQMAVLLLLTAWALRRKDTA